MAKNLFRRFPSTFSGPQPWWFVKQRTLGENAPLIADDFFEAVAGGIFETTGTSSGTSSVTGVGAVLVTSTGSSTGASSVSGVGAVLIVSVGSSTGASTVAGVGATIAASVGQAAGFSTVLGVSDVGGGRPIIHSMEMLF